MYCIPRQNKLETPKEKDEVNKREVHEFDVRTNDPDTMVVPPTPKPTFKSEAHYLVREIIVRLFVMNRESVRLFFVYYESIKRELKTKPIYACR